MRRQYVIALVLSGVFFACAPQSSRTPPAIPDRPVDDRGAADRVGFIRSWTLRPDTTSIAYTSTIHTSLQDQTDALATVDSIRIITSFTSAISSAPSPISVSGTILSIVTTSGRHLQLSGSASLPLFFQGNPRHGISLGGSTELPPRNPPCPNDLQVILAALQHAHLVLPASVIAPGFSWTDSLTVPACVGPVPITLTTIQTHQVLDPRADSRPGVFAVRRTGTITGAGRGALEQHNVSLELRGTDSTLFYLDQLTGRLVELSGNRTAGVGITASGKTRVFRQVTREYVSRSRI